VGVIAVRRRLGRRDVARWSANPLGMLWSEMNAAFAASGGNGGGTAAMLRLAAIAAGWALHSPGFPLLQSLDQEERMPLGIARHQLFL
jgi:hypothetical protein